MTIKNILVVEDEDKWLSIYKRNIERLKYPLKLSRNLHEAIDILNEMAFAVAIIDMRLDKYDDRNVDGLRVLEEIVSIGDVTSSIVVTGFGTMQIARDAIKKYNAFDTIEKGDIDPDVIENLISRAMKDYQNRSSIAKVEAFQLLRGDRMGWDWEHEMLREINPKGGIPTIEKFLDTLVLSFIPIIPKNKKSGITVSLDTKIASGYYWSRSIGMPIAIAYGEKKNIDIIIGNLQKANDLLGNEYILGDQLKDFSKANLRGIVWRIKNKNRNDFGM